MKDRVPSAPGRYTATITDEERAKMLAGEDFNITLVRNDAPTVEGTPYNKASVLPDSLATTICPDVTDPTPADALAALMPKNVYDTDSDGIVDNSEALGGYAASSFMMKSGGTFTGNTIAYSTNRTTNSIRNIAVYDSTGATLQSTNSIELWRK